MDLQILIIRHGETEWNLEGRKQGRGDSALTAKGEAQIRSIAEYLLKTDIPIENFKLVVSPLGRTRRSAEIFCQSVGLSADNIVLEPLLVEADHGVCEGLTSDEIQRQHPQATLARQNDRWHARFPDGESYHDVELRAEKWLTSLTERKRYIAITHAMTSKAIRKVYSGCSIEEIDAQLHEHGTYYELDSGRVERIKVL